MSTPSALFHFQPGNNTMRKLKAQIIDEAGFERTITRLAHEILEKNKGAESIGIVGIRTRGEFIARRIARILSKLTRNSIRKILKSSGTLPTKKMGGFMAIYP